jgi:hypothetical protein
MADISLVIDVKQNGVVSAVKNTKSLEGNVKLLSNSFKSGALSQRQYYKGLLELSNVTGKSEAEVRRYANELRRLERVSAAAAAAARAEAQAVRDYTNARRQANEENRRRLAIERAAAAASQAAIQAARSQADISRRLRMEFREGYAAQVALRAAQMRLNQARRQGIVTDEEYTRQLARLGDVTRQSSQHMSRSGVAMQQVGYQVGDFIVQIQSGQNPMIAFGQQATQMVGALYMLPPATLAASVPILGLSVSVGLLIASLGIIIPLATAVGAAFMRFKKENDKAANAASSLDEKIKSLNSSLEDFAALQESIANGVSLDELFAVKNIDQAKKDIKDLEDSMVALFGSGIKDLIGTEDGDAIIDMFGTGKAKKYRAALKELEEARLTLGKLEERQDIERGQNFDKNLASINNEIELLEVQAKFGADSAQARNAQLAQELKLSKDANDALEASFEISAGKAEILNRQLQAQFDLNRLVEEQTAKEGKRLEAIKLYYDYTQNIIEVQKTNKEAVDAIKKSVADTVKGLEDELALNKEILKFGKDSAQVKALEAEQARAQYKLAQEDALIKGNNLVTVMAIYDENVKVTNEIEASAGGAKNLADALKDAADAMSSLFNVGSLESKLAGLVAETNAIKTGADSASASLVAVELSKARALRDTSLAGGIDPGFVNEAYNNRVGLINQVGDATTANNTAKDNARDSASSAKKSGSEAEKDAKKFFEYLSGKEAELKLQTQLVGIFGDERDIRSELFKAQTDYAGLITPAQTKELEGTLRQTKAIEEQQSVLEDARKQQEALVDFIGSSMENSLMGIVDGTMSVKDAFKSMAADIIKELYRVLVVQQLVNSAKMAMGGFFADGGAFSGGSQIQAYANGGIVGGPTTFPMSGGKTGLMGEAGPEAIMPLKRGANGKLGVQMEGGGGDTIVVNQSFNFQANGDATIKQLIAQAAPKIAQMTKSSLLDDRRRGGSTKAAFG